MKNLSIQNAYRYCEKTAKSHYENFPVGSLLIPKNKRPFVWSVYAFARTADDFADENYPSRNEHPNLDAWREAIRQGESARLEKLNDWERQLKACYGGAPTHPIFEALAHTVKALEIPQKPLADLLDAFKMDATKRRYEDWKELLHYCRHSANPVGRLILTIFGYRDEELFLLSDAICTGLQLANFWQDVAVDREKDRIYIPLELLRKHGLSDRWILQPTESQGWNALREELRDFTLDFFRKGAPLPGRVKGRLSWELRCTWLGGMTILNRSCKSTGRKMVERPVIRMRDKLSILFKSLWGYHRQVQILSPSPLPLSLEGEGTRRVGEGEQ